MKGLIVSILKNNYLGDCTANGVTSKVDSIILVGEGVEGPFEPKKDVPYLQLVKQNLWGEDYLHAIPMLNGEKINAGKNSMMGGHFVYSSDSRFHQVNPYPIPVHDRFEF